MRVSFVTHGDRLSHEISIVDQGYPSNRLIGELMSSIEGTSIDAWPPSPPWQQIVAERVAPDNREVLLGVGLSGNGHWSIVIEPKVEDSTQWLRFDTACKVSKPASFLGSCYRLSEDCEVQEWDRTRIVFEVGTEPQTMQVSLLACIGGVEWLSSERVLRITPEADGSTPGTYRWVYSISVAMESNHSQ